MVSEGTRMHVGNRVRCLPPRVEIAGCSNSAQGFDPNLRCAGSKPRTYPAPQRRATR